MESKPLNLKFLPLDHLLDDYAISNHFLNKLFINIKNTIIIKKRNCKKKLINDMFYKMGV